MPPYTIVELPKTADELLIEMYNGSRMKKTKSKELTPGVKVATVLLEMHEDITPTQYAELSTKIKAVVVNAVAGVQGITLVCDNQDAGGTVQTVQTEQDVPEGRKLVVYVTTHFRLDSIPVGE